MQLLEWRKNPVLFGAILALLSAGVFLGMLGSQALIDYDEAAYGMVLEDTREAGQFASLTTAGRNWFDKPPLYFWAAEAFALLGLPIEWYLRLPAALSGIACVLLVYAIVLRVTRRPLVAFLGGAIILTTSAFVAAAREARMDAPIAACVLAAFYALLRVRDDSRWWLLFGAAVGTGIMIKSAVGILPLFLFVSWAVIERELGWWREKMFWLGALLGAAIAIPWHLYQTALFGLEFWKSYLGVHVLERYSENLFQNQVTPLHYFEYTSVHALPWAVLFGILIVFLVARPRWFESHVGKVAAISALAAVLIGALFLTAETVVIHYLVPLYPLFAISVILGATVFWDRFGKKHATWVPIALTICAFGIGGAVTGMAALHFSDAFSYEQRLAEDEQAIGAAIGLAPEIPVLFDRPVFWETIRYYSGRRDEFSVFHEAGPLQAPFFVVGTPNGLANDSQLRELFDHHEVVYHGEYASLLIVR
jgi:4-amino-4-deoxy-L-arabinose transferase-like glycosyltransferase